MVDRNLDCCGLVCPMPIVKLSKAVREMDSGQILEVKANDQAFKVDVEAWCNKTGNLLEAIEILQETIIATIKII